MDFLHFLAQYRTPAGDLFFQGVTYLAQETFVVAVICWLFWCSDRRLAYCLGFAYFTSGLLIQGLKITFRVPRPWVLDPDFAPVASAVGDATGYSFPSGHTQSITALLGTLSLCARKYRFRFLCGLGILLVGFSRMYLGCHTLQDVGTAFCVSLLCAFLCWYFFYKRNLGTGREGIVCIVLLAVCALLLIYTGSLYGSGALPEEFAADCVKACGAGAAFAIGYYLTETRIPFAVPDSTGKKFRRFLVGIAVTLVLQTGLKPLLSASLPASFVRYFIVVFWIITVYPLLFHRYSQKRGESGAQP